MLLRRALRSQARCASGLDPPCPGRCPDRWRHRFPSPLRPFWKKRAAGRHPQKPIAGRGRCPLRTNPRTRRGAEGNGRPFPSRASVALHSVKGLSRHILAAARLRYSTFPLTAFPRSRPRPSAPITPGKALRGRGALPVRLHTGRGLAGGENARIRGKA